MQVLSNREEKKGRDLGEEGSLGRTVCRGNRWLKEVGLGTLGKKFERGERGKVGTVVL